MGILRRLLISGFIAAVVSSGFVVPAGATGSPADRPDRCGLLKNSEVGKAFDGRVRHRVRTSDGCAWDVRTPAGVVADVNVTTLSGYDKKRFDAERAELVSPSTGLQAQTQTVRYVGDRAYYVPEDPEFKTREIRVLKDNQQLVVHEVDLPDIGSPNGSGTPQEVQAKVTKLAKLAAERL